jgi:hypothetical protein
MATKKRQYLNALLKMDSEWILESLLSPSDCMSDIHIALHRIALRKRGVLKK